MIGSALMKRLFGSRNDRVVKQLSKVVEQINAFESTLQALSDAQLQAKTAEFRQRLADGATLDSLLPEAFAVVREASQRVLSMRHFDVQMIGGMVLHGGKIAEMGTGEGKTLVATLPAYLNALPSLGVHIVTVNDYLAKRDAEWMRPLYEFLGLTVGVNLSQMLPQDKREAFACDITYGTNNEFGFDYLRDNMAFSLGDKVQRKLHYAIVDEVDSILIDEARTPLIISGMAEESSELYVRINRLIPKLKKQEEENGPGDFSLDEKSRQAHLTEQGHNSVEELLIKEGLLQEGDNLYAVKNIPLMHHLYACLRAYHLFTKDVDYIVKDNEIIIVDEHTGRTMVGRRWSDGLHQAIEAKENVRIQPENHTLASITFQNYFRLYNKLSGMTGTADTEAYEFQQIYGLEVIVIPTNKPIARKDLTDKVFLTQQEKFTAVIADIKEAAQRQQPVLVGTASIESSEHLSKLLTKEKIPHQVLNAKYHEKEAQIIAEAGRPGIVTIATNMAGRGTDIVLGGNLQSEIKQLQDPTPEQIEQLKQDWQNRHEKVLAAGGLHVVGSERHEARRIDNQLRGRCGRQGDPGSTRFYLSLQDNLMRIFASDKMGAIMQRLGMKEGDPIEHPWVNKAIESAQRKVEGHNFDIRKQLLEFDDVANEQRKWIYEQRAELMASDDVSQTIEAIRSEILDAVIDQYIPRDSLEEQWDVAGLDHELETEFNLKLNIVKRLQEDEHLNEDGVRHLVLQSVIENHQQKEEKLGAQAMRQFEKSILLQSLDSLWKDHLAAMDYLRQGIHLRGYAQKNPKQEYKREAFQLFTNLLRRIDYDVISTLARMQLQAQTDVEELEAQRREANQYQMDFQHPSVNQPAAAVLPQSAGAAMPANEAAGAGTFTRNQPKIGRNDPCPCGSGKKYKSCHGQLENA